MLVRMTEANSELYTSLFADFMVTYPDTIVDSLATYFEAMQQLQDDEVDIEPRFLRIPLTDDPDLNLQEEHFVIDANTRTIHVPNAFKQNGLSVQGDHTAEIIFFEMDRYFDAMDLGACDIFIQWKNSDGIERVSSAYAVDDSEPDKLIFGWVITDAITNTKTAGDVNFSVRFRQLKKGTQEIAYSYSTLTAKCAIKPALNFTFDDSDIEYADDLMAHRRIYSNVPHSSFVGLPSIVESWETEMDLINGELELTATIKSPDGGSLTYQWFNEDVAVADKAEIDAATAATATNVSYIAKTAGKYYVQVDNYITDRGFRGKSSDICVIPAAEAFEMTAVTMPLKSYVGSALQYTAGASNGVISYAWYDGDAVIVNTTDSLTTTAAGDYKCVAVNTRNNSTWENVSDTAYVRAEPVAPTDISVSWDDVTKELSCIAVPSVENDPYVTLRYQWYNRETGKISGATSAVYVPKASGEYECRVSEVVFPGEGTLEHVAHADSETISVII